MTTILLYRISKTIPIILQYWEVSDGISCKLQLDLAALSIPISPSPQLPKSHLLSPSPGCSRNSYGCCFSAHSFPPRGCLFSWPFMTGYIACITNPSPQPPLLARLPRRRPSRIISSMPGSGCLFYALFVKLAIIHGARAHRLCSTIGMAIYVLPHIAIPITNSNGSSVLQYCRHSTQHHHSDYMMIVRVYSSSIKP